MCKIGRLAEVCKGDFNTIPIVNTENMIIGMVPKHFIIVLIEHKMFYEYNYLSKRKTTVADAFKSYRDRTNSQMTSPMSPSNTSQDKIKLRINPSDRFSSDLKEEDVDGKNSDDSFDLDDPRYQKKVGSDQASED